MTHDEAMVAVDQAQRYVASLGLHGVLILSYACPTCGECHDFVLASDLAEGQGEELVQHFASLIDNSPGVKVHVPGRMVQ